MANTIDLAKVYVPICDEVYKEASLTADLDGAEELMREGYNANEMIVPTIDMDGLGDYSRNDGYTKGDATVTWETHKCNFDRGRMFSVDDLDNIETGGVAFGKLMGEFIRTKTVPELDAFRFSKYASADDISIATGSLEDGESVVKALSKAHDQMNDDEVPTEGRILYITSEAKSLIDDLDTTKSRAALNKASKVVVVPKSRFYSKITQLSGSDDQKVGGYIAAKGSTFTATGDGSTKKFTIAAKPALIDKVTVDGKVETAYTYDKATGELTFTTAPANSKAVAVTYGSGRPLNFMIIHPSAVLQFQKVVKPKIISPDVNPDGDAWKYGYRNVGIADVYKNKVAGIYAHIS